MPCAQDPHPDHAAVHHAAVHHAAVSALQGLPVVPTLLGYPVWTWHAGPLFLAEPTARRLRLQAWAARQLWSAPWWRLPAGRYAAQKRQAVAAYRSQTTNLTGEPGWSHLPPEFVRLFLGTHEMFLPVHTADVRQDRATG